MRRIIGATALALAISFSAKGEDQRTFAERLGWNATNVVVILHVDDVGMSHSSNLGVIEATEKGVATSCSVMMPCSWVPEIARYLLAHPEVDSGLHLTLTSEWRLYRWGPLAGKAQVPGLVDNEGCLWHTVEQVAANASPDEIEREIRAQIERAEKLGTPMTHLDSHMGTLFARADYFERFARIGMEKKIPVLVVGGQATHLTPWERAAAEKLRPWTKKIWNAGLPVLDDLFTGFTSFKKEEKTERLLALLQDLKPGVDRPKRISGRKRHACIHGTQRENTGRPQRHIRRERQPVPSQRQRRGQTEAQPICWLKKPRPLWRGRHGPGNLMGNRVRL